MADKRPVAVFDVDGTIVRSSLVIEMTHELIRRGIFPQEAEQKFIDERDAWLNRRGHYDDYVNKIVDVYTTYLVGQEVSKIQEVADKVAKDQAHKTYRYTKDLVAKLKDSHFLLAISGSGIDSVQSFVKIHGFDLAYGSEIASKDGLYTNQTLVYGAREKGKTLDRIVDEHNLTLESSIGVGDTENDISFLEMVDQPIVFNPNSELLETAKNRGWKVVVERKDVVYELDIGDNGKHTLIS
ncbi:MAG: HAD-IB family hydrolase [Candidatus Saccharimonadales bacterium]